MTRTARIFGFVLCFALLQAPLGWSQREEEPIDVEHHRARRARFQSAMEGGIAVIMASKKDQDFIYEFFVPRPVPKLGPFERPWL